jgi:hypothetical protein
MCASKFHTHTKQQDITVLYILIFKFLGSRLEDKRFCCSQPTGKKIFKVNKESVLRYVLVSWTDGWLCSYLDLVHQRKCDFVTVCFPLIRVFVSYTYILIVPYFSDIGSDTQQWSGLYLPISGIKNCLRLQWNEKGATYSLLNFHILAQTKSAE